MKIEGAVTAMISEYPFKLVHVSIIKHGFEIYILSHSLPPGLLFISLHGGTSACKKMADRFETLYNKLLWHVLKLADGFETLCPLWHNLPPGLLAYLGLHQGMVRVSKWCQKGEPLTVTFYSCVTFGMSCLAVTYMVMMKFITCLGHAHWVVDETGKPCMCVPLALESVLLKTSYELHRGFAAYTCSGPLTHPGQEIYYRWSYIMLQASRFIMLASFLSRVKKLFYVSLCATQNWWYGLHKQVGFSHVQGPIMYKMFFSCWTAIDESW